MAKKSRLAAKQPTILEFAVGNIDQETFDEVADKISLEMSRMLFRHQVDRCLITPGLKGAFMYVHVLKAEYFNEFKKSLNSTSRFIVSSLRDHIFKENNILYPTALDVIKENKVWNKMKTECDKIGYCSFTKL